MCSCISITIALIEHVYDVERLLMCLYYICIFSLGTCHFNLLPIFKLDFFPYCWALSVLYIFWTQIIFQICDLQIFSPSLYLIFNSLNSVSHDTEVFNFDKVLFINFVFEGLCFWCHVQELCLTWFCLTGLSSTFYPPKTYSFMFDI